MERSLTDCFFFLQGSCTKVCRLFFFSFQKLMVCDQGESCDFRHSQIAALNPVLCKFWLSGTCTNPKCLFKHPQLPVSDIRFSHILDLTQNNSLSRHRRQPSKIAPKFLAIMKHNQADVQRVRAVLFFINRLLAAKMKMKQKMNLSQKILIREKVQRMRMESTNLVELFHQDWILSLRLKQIKKTQSPCPKL
jgi:hypothetical protein